MAHRILVRGHQMDPWRSVLRFLSGPLCDRKGRRKLQIDLLVGASTSEDDSWKRGVEGLLFFCTFR